MARRIPDEKIKDIQQATNIVDIISEYVQLKKQGRNYFGLCPFHGENTPSFSVSMDKQIYHCFGCGAGGDAFSFLMEIEGLSFREAALKLAEKNNIAIEMDEVIQHQPSPASLEQKQMIEAHELLSKFYHHLLMHTNEGQQALEYLLNRGMTKESIQTFQIGYALPTWDFAVKFLNKRGFSSRLLEKAGLIIKKDSYEEYFDRFRNRIMFPLKNEKGETVGFSGRALEEEQPKYLNSPETAIFNKSSMLYHYHQARGAVRRKNKVILFEGFMDVISAHRADIHHAVATMGTALTEKHIQLLRRLTDTVIICFDADQAGMEAAHRAADLLAQDGCGVQIALMPSELDPDDYIQQYGEAKFRQDIIGDTLTLMAFKMRYYRHDKNMQNEGERLQYIENVLREVAKLPKAVERDYYLRQLAEEFSLSLEAMKQQQRQIYFADKRKNNVQHTPIHLNTIPAETSKKLPPAYQTAERRLLAHMLRDEDVAYKIKDLLNGEQLHSDEHQAILTYLYGYYEAGNTANTRLFLHYLPDDSLRRIVIEIEMMPLNEEEIDQEIEDYVKQVLKHQKMLKIKNMEAEQKEAERQKDYEKAAMILKEIVAIRKSLA